MPHQLSRLTGLIGIGATISLVQPRIASAKTSVEIGETAKAITVLITEPNSVGSGVILQQQGDIHTVLTAAHVVKNKVSYKITTPDDRQYEAIASSIRHAPGSIDLAVIKFKSRTKYPTAKLGNCNVLKSGMDLYVAGFPGTSRAIAQSVFVFREGKVSANSNKTFEKGYSLVYSNDTLPGMSGGAVLNGDGELVAIHGRGDRDDRGGKNGFNLGIPVNRFATVATTMGVELGVKVAPIPQNTGLRADDYIASAAQKQDKGDDRGAVADLDRAIQLEPNNAEAYNNRGYFKSKLADIQGALADYNRAIQLNPKYTAVYSNRGLLKTDNLQDIQGGLADYNRAIQLNPKYAYAYNNRGLLKADKLYDFQGALADYDRAIQLDSKSPAAYNNRGFLKATKLQDIQRGLTDIDRAIAIEPKFATAYFNRGAIKHEQLQDFKGALADYNLAIQRYPNFARVYNNRGLLKADRLHDVPGGLADLDRSIQLEPNNAAHYSNRAGVKSQHLQDYRGALIDYNRAIQLDPSRAADYGLRGVLKHERLNDRSGGINDLQAAASIFQKQGNTKLYERIIKLLKKWQATSSRSTY
jgi:tetratricopeptide (TPR) repeat protein